MRNSGTWHLVELFPSLLLVHLTLVSANQILSTGPGWSVGNNQMDVTSRRQNTAEHNIIKLQNDTTGEWIASIVFDERHQVSQACKDIVGEMLNTMLNQFTCRDNTPPPQALKTTDHRISQSQTTPVGGTSYLPQIQIVKVQILNANTSEGVITPKDIIINNPLTGERQMINATESSLLSLAENGYYEIEIQADGYEFFTGIFPQLQAPTEIRLEPKDEEVKSKDMTDQNTVTEEPTTYPTYSVSTLPPNQDKECQGTGTLVPWKPELVLNTDSNCVLFKIENGVEVPYWAGKLQIGAVLELPAGVYVAYIQDQSVGGGMLFKKWTINCSGSECSQSTDGTSISQKDYLGLLKGFLIHKVVLLSAQGSTLRGGFFTLVNSQSAKYLRFGWGVVGVLMIPKMSFRFFYDDGYGQFAFGALICEPMSSDSNECKLRPIITPVSDDVSVMNIEIIDGKTNTKSDNYVIEIDGEKTCGWVLNCLELNKTRGQTYNVTVIYFHNQVKTVESRLVTLRERVNNVTFVFDRPTIDIESTTTSPSVDGNGSLNLNFALNVSLARPELAQGLIAALHASNPALAWQLIALLRVRNPALAEQLTIFLASLTVAPPSTAGTGESNGTLEIETSAAVTLAPATDSMRTTASQTEASSSAANIPDKGQSDRNGQFSGSLSVNATGKRDLGDGTVGGGHLFGHLFANGSLDQLLAADPALKDRLLAKLIGNGEGANSSVAKSMLGGFLINRTTLLMPQSENPQSVTQTAAPQAREITTADSRTEPGTTSAQTTETTSTTKTTTLAPLVPGAEIGSITVKWENSLDMDLATLGIPVEWDTSKDEVCYQFQLSKPRQRFDSLPKKKCSNVNEGHVSSIYGGLGSDTISFVMKDESELKNRYYAIFAYDYKFITPTRPSASHESIIRQAKPVVEVTLNQGKDSETLAYGETIGAFTMDKRFWFVGCVKLDSSNHLAFRKVKGGNTFLNLNFVGSGYKSVWTTVKSECDKLFK